MKSIIILFVLATSLFSIECLRHKNKSKTDILDSFKALTLADIKEETKIQASLDKTIEALKAKKSVCFHDIKELKKELKIEYPRIKKINDAAAKDKRYASLEKFLKETQKLVTECYAAEVAGTIKKFNEKYQEDFFKHRKLEDNKDEATCIKKLEEIKKRVTGTAPDCVADVDAAITDIKKLYQEKKYDEAGVEYSTIFQKTYVCHRAFVLSKKN